MKTYIATKDHRPAFMKDLPPRTTPTATCSKCKKLRAIPEGHKPVTSLCADCMMEVEFELKDLFAGSKQREKKLPQA